MVTNKPADILLSIRNLSVNFNTDDGVLQAVRNVSLELHHGEILGLVGESGCGKSVTSMCIPRLIPQPPGIISNGEIYFEGRNLLTTPLNELQKIRGKEIGVIFQEPMTALTPLHRIRKQMAEGIIIHNLMPESEIEDYCLHWLKKVGIASPERCMNAFPYELSGGMRQRIMIAMALMLRPKLIIADEPTTALDATIQAQILDLMQELMAENPQMSLLLITHDLGVVWEICDKVAVMYAGEIVETCDSEALFSHPLHPYTKGLINSLPANQIPGQQLKYIAGQVPSLIAPLPGCQFASRCPSSCDICNKISPKSTEYQTGHFAACHNISET